jgi:hypothetical protein
MSEWRWPQLPGLWEGFKQTMGPGSLLKRALPGLPRARRPEGGATVGAPLQRPPAPLERRWGPGARHPHCLACDLGDEPGEAGERDPPLSHPVGGLPALTPPRRACSGKRGGASARGRGRGAGEDAEGGTSEDSGEAQADGGGWGRMGADGGGVAGRSRAGGGEARCEGGMDAAGSAGAPGWLSWLIPSLQRSPDHPLAWFGL